MIDLAALQIMLMALTGWLHHHMVGSPLDLRNGLRESGAPPNIGREPGPVREQSSNGEPFVMPSGFGA